MSELPIYSLMVDNVCFVVFFFLSLNFGYRLVVKFVEFMKFQIARNRQIYREALPGISLLHWRGRLAVRISFVLYKAILGEIERANYNVFAGRVRTNRQQKILLSIKALAGVYE